MILLSIYQQRRKQKNRYPHHESTEHERAVEIQIEKEKARRNGPPGGFGGM